jgi:hypothetical protein
LAWNELGRLGAGPERKRWVSIRDDASNPATKAPAADYHPPYISRSWIIR